MFEGVVIRDVFGQVRDEAWLRREYGDVGLHRAGPGPGWRLLEIQENRDIADGEQPEPVRVATAAGPFQRIAPQAAATLICRVVCADGRPAVNLRIAWYWPDAPEDPGCAPLNGYPPELRPGRAVDGFTNLNGDSGMPMGGGAYYVPGVKPGPHACWIYGANSDILFALGMRWGTNHDHLDFLFGQTAEEPPVPPVPDGDKAALLARVAAIEGECTALRILLQ